ncbi:hypothetical protein NP233_g937 [Leucocoprinus birnbaumii]|uniref:Uncharacterized protein n=1 Tax=Leucocoprinus birnbaumii TaxID=56174 RepID=A0AAD5W0Y1_9AGAR|nr:hypothetical protein NP233_g937 [Leucocoprinus birnbaumii]
MDLSFDFIGSGPMDQGYNQSHAPQQNGLSHNASLVPGANQYAQQNNSQYFIREAIRCASHETLVANQNSAYRNLLEKNQVLIEKNTLLSTFHHEISNLSDRFNEFKSAISTDIQNLAALIQSGPIASPSSDSPPSSASALPPIADPGPLAPWIVRNPDGRRSVGYPNFVWLKVDSTHSSRPDKDDPKFSIKYWKQLEWTNYMQTHGNTSKNLYITDFDGTPIAKDTVVNKINIHAYDILCQLTAVIHPALPASSYMKNDPDFRKHFEASIENKYEYLALCQDSWKARNVGINIYTNFFSTLNRRKGTSQVKVKEEGRSKGKGKARAQSPDIDQERKDLKRKHVPDVPGDEGTPTPMSKHPRLSDDLTQNQTSSDASTLVNVAPAASSSSSSSATPEFSISNPFERSPSPPLPISKVRTLDMTALANDGFAFTKTSAGVKASSLTILKHSTLNHIVPSHPVQTLVPTPLAPLVTTRTSPISLETALSGGSTSGKDVVIPPPSPRTQSSPSPPPLPKTSATSNTSSTPALPTISALLNPPTVSDTSALLNPRTLPNSNLSASLNSTLKNNLALPSGFEPTHGTNPSAGGPQEDTNPMEMTIPPCGPLPSTSLTQGYTISEAAWEGKVRHMLPTSPYKPSRKKVDNFDAENMCGREWIKKNKNATNYDFAMHWARLNALERLEWFQKAYEASSSKGPVQVEGSKSQPPTEKNKRGAGRRSAKRAT